jgi:hypothetical protein
MLGEVCMGCQCCRLLHSFVLTMPHLCSSSSITVTLGLAEVQGLLLAQSGIDREFRTWTHF